MRPGDSDWLSIQGSGKLKAYLADQAGGNPETESPELPSIINLKGRWWCGKTNPLTHHSPRGPGQRGAPSGFTLDSRSVSHAESWRPLCLDPHMTPWEERSHSWEQDKQIHNITWTYKGSLLPDGLPSLLPPPLHTGAL